MLNEKSVLNVILDNIIIFIVVANIFFFAGFIYGKFNANKNNDEIYFRLSKHCVNEIDLANKAAFEEGKEYSEYLNSLR